MTPLRPRFSPPSLRPWSSFKSWQWLANPARLYLGYTLFFSLFKVLMLTLATYLMVSTSPVRPKFEDINEVLVSNQVIFMALASVLFTLLLVALGPLTHVRVRDFFQPAWIERAFLFGFQGGALLSTGVVLAFVLSGTYAFLGVLVRLDEAPLTLLGIGLRALGLGVFVYFEEFIFRGKILMQLRKAGSGLPGDFFAILISAVAYCVTKVFQFDLGVMHLITLFLVAVSLGLRQLAEGSFARGAGFWAAVLMIFHSILSLPIFGNDYSGLFLVKYQSVSGQDAASSTSRFLTGGLGGPLSSFAFQVLLLLDILRGLLDYQKNLLRRIQPQLN